MKVTQIGHVAYVCKDLERSVAFYRDVLGFTPKFSLSYGDFLDMNLDEARRAGVDPDPEMVARLSAKKDRTWITYMAFGDCQFVELFDANGATLPGATDWDHLNFSHLALLVDDIQAACAELTARGVPIDTAPKIGSDQTWQMWSHDPDGNKIEFMQYTENSWQLVGRPE